MQTPLKGIYPSWMDENDIINKLLNEIIRHGGKLPLNFVLNEANDESTNNRMKSIIETMRNERLIVSPLEGMTGFLEIDIEGSRAIQTGYRKYKRIKRWDSTLDFLSKFSLIFLLIAVIGVIGFVVYLILHYFKVL